MKAITTKYIGPTNHKMARVKAIAEGGHSITVDYDYNLSAVESYAKAAIALARKMEWTGELIAGSTKDGYVFVFANSGKYEI